MGRQPKVARGGEGRSHKLQPRLSHRVPGQRASQLSDRSEQGKCETVTAQGGGAEGASGRSARCGPRQNSGMQKGKDGEGEEERKTERKGKRQEQGRKPRLKLWLWIRVMLREASLVNVDCE